MPSSVEQVNNTGKTTSAGRQESRKLPEDKILKRIAQNLDISVNELKSMLVEKNVPNGKGITTLARENNMNMKDFCQLNGIDYNNWRNYKAGAKEIFYVISNTGKQSGQNDKNISAENLSEKIYELSSKHFGAVGKPDFDALINQINSQNASEVIKSYTENKTNKNKESLINTITSEISSDKQARKDAVLKIYDALAAEKGTPASVRESFVKELDKQFNSFGMVSTKKLDETITRMMATPQELAVKMESDIDHTTGAVGKESFNELMSLVNSENAEELIKAYNALATGESLIEGITSEIRSSKEARKESVLKIYDALANAKGTPPAVREEFIKELDDQFNSFGMVNTEKLDKIINDIISTPANTNTKPATTTTKMSGPKIKFSKNSEVKTASEWRRGAISSAKKEAVKRYKEFCKENNIKFNEDDLDLTPLDRIPEPHSDNGKVCAKSSTILKPTDNQSANGKIIILNPGHGGYSSRSGFFDPGSYSFIKKGNGKYAPLLEYEKMNSYAENLADKLQRKGYSVVIVNGHAHTFTDQKSISNIVTDLNTKNYNNDDIIFISLHADSEPGKSGSGICFDPRFKEDSYLADKLKDNLNHDDWINTTLSERNWQVKGKGLQVLHQTEGIPSVLIEVEYVNGSKSRNLDSKAYQTRFENKLIDGINSYFQE